jgi:hypothetical protein
VPDVQYPDDPISNPSTIRIEDLLASDDAPATDAPVREGLPRSFRMRADKHYVEMLDGPPLRPASVESPPPTHAVAVSIQDTSDPGVDVAVAQAGRELAQSLAALRACTNLLSDRGPALASSVAGNLIRAEAWRATCLLQATRFLRHEIVAAPKPTSAQSVVDQVLKSIEPERRLRGIAIDERITVGDSRIVVDEELMVGALSGLVLATIALQDDQSGLVVTVRAEAQGGEVVFTVAQGQVRATADWATEAVTVLSAGRIVEACGGRMAVAATAGGTDVRISLPRGR